jgi:hypothetical protein
LLVLATFLFQYRMDFTETACVCALLLRIRRDRRKKRHWVHPVVSKRLLNGQFYKLYEDLRNSRGKFFSYFRTSIESFDKLLVLVGPRITYENTYENISGGPGSSVSIETDYGLDAPEIESRWRRDFPPFQTGPGAHPASCTMGTGFFSAGKLRRGRAADHLPPSSAEVLEE